MRSDCHGGGKENGINTTPPKRRCMLSSLHNLGAVRAGGQWQRGRHLVEDDAMVNQCLGGRKPNCLKRAKRCARLRCQVFRVAAVDGCGCCTPLRSRLLQVHFSPLPQRVSRRELHIPSLRRTLSITLFRDNPLLIRIPSPNSFIDATDLFHGITPSCLAGSGIAGSPNMFPSDSAEQPRGPQDEQLIAAFAPILTVFCQPRARRNSRYSWDDRCLSLASDARSALCTVSGGRRLGVENMGLTKSLHWTNASTSRYLLLTQPVAWEVYSC